MKCVANSLADAMTGVALLRALLDDAGELETPTPISAGSDWHIFTTTVESRISLQELISGTNVYHQGFSLRVVMGAA